MTDPTRGLQGLIEPSSIAVVGASNRPGHFAHQPLVNLRLHGFAGEVYPVNPRHTEVAGFRCYPSLSDIPSPPDLVLVVVPAEAAVDCVQQAGELGARAAIVVGSGFAETSSGVATQERLAAAIAETGIRVCGPNTLGVANFHDGIVPFASANLPATPRLGPVAIVSQSGGCSFTLLNRAWRTGIGVGHIAVGGNEIDVTLPDFIEHYLRRADVTAVACYIEAIRDPQGLARVGELSRSLDKPVFVMKAGASERGQRSAAAHTGALASSDAVCETAFRQWGLIRAHSFDELIGAAALGGRYGAVPPQRFGVYAQGGGIAVVSSDLFEAAGIELPEIAADTATRIKDRLPDATPGNPFDSGGQFLSQGSQPLTEALVDFSADAAVTAMVHFMMPVVGDRQRVYADGIVNAAAASAKPTAVLHYGAGPMTADTLERFAGADLLVLDPPEAGVVALKLWSGSATAEPAGSVRRRSDPGAAARARRIIAEWRQSAVASITENVAGELLDVYGIRRTRQVLVHNESDVEGACAVMQAPYVVKVDSPDVAHRSDVGGVLLNLGDADAVRHAIRAVADNVTAAHPRAQIRGFTISETAPEGVELIVGMTVDHTFGPVVLLGLGGIYAETLKDSALRLPPLGDADVAEMVDSLAGAALIRGARGKSGVDLAVLADTVARVGELAVDLADELVTFELNPLIAGRGDLPALAADALIELRQKD